MADEPLVGTSLELLSMKEEAVRLSQYRSASVKQGRLNGTLVEVTYVTREDLDLLGGYMYFGSEYVCPYALYVGAVVYGDYPLVSRSCGSPLPKQLPYRALANAARRLALGLRDLHAENLVHGCVGMSAVVWQDGEAKLRFHGLATLPAYNQHGMAALPAYDQRGIALSALSQGCSKANDVHDLVRLLDEMFAGYEGQENDELQAIRSKLRAWKNKLDAGQNRDFPLGKVLKRLPADRARSSGTASTRMPSNRLALIISNSDYTDKEGHAAGDNMHQLPGAAHDATTVQQLLKDVGYKCIHRFNQRKAAIMGGVNLIAKAVKQEKTTVFIYYSGHGIQHCDQLCIVLPKRLSGGYHNDLLPINDVVEGIRGMVVGNLFESLRFVVIFDACRRVGASDGFPPRQIKSTLFVTTTLAGKPALECIREEKGIYVQYLQRLLNKDAVVPGVFMDIRAAMTNARESQLPVEQNALTESFYLATGLKCDSHVKLVAPPSPMETLADSLDMPGARVALNGKLMDIANARERSDSLPDCAELSILKGPVACLPRGVLQLKGIKALLLSSIGLTELPAEIGELKELRRLLVAHNMLRALPASLGGCLALQVLHAHGNRLVDLPIEFKSLSRLTYINVSENCLQRLPLLDLPESATLDVHANCLACDGDGNALLEGALAPGKCKAGKVVRHGQKPPPN